MTGIQHRFNSINGNSVNSVNSVNPALLSWSRARCENRGLTFRHEDDGTVVPHGRFPPEMDARILGALDAVMKAGFDATSMVLLRIPVDSDHPFHCIPITDSIPNRVAGLVTE